MAKGTLALWALRAIIAATGLLAGGAGVSVEEARAHQSGCHTSHTCPSDHHTYVWRDRSGRTWDCAKRSSDAYDETQDTTRIVYDGRTWFCRAAGSAATSEGEPSWFSRNRDTILVGLLITVGGAMILGVLKWLGQPLRRRLVWVLELAVRRALRRRTPS